MFNHFFYSPDGPEVLQQFMSQSPNTLAIVIDPPFGGRAEFLNATITKIWEVAGIGMYIGGMEEFAVYDAFPPF